MRFARRRLATVLAATGLALGLCAAPAVAAGPDPAVAGTAATRGAHSTSTIGWSACGSGFQCGTQAVPLDYSRPHGQMISLALIRLPAGDPAHRIGTLFVNPGGPGDSGVAFVRDEAITTFSASVRSRFDIVGFDPRGVGASTPLQCFASDDDEAAVFADVPVFPVNHREVIATDQANAKLSKACAKREPELAAHLSTGDVARDLDRLRQAVGDDQITFVGYSYGTYIAAVYANMFPRRVRAIVADGVINPIAWVGAGRAGRTVPVDVRLQSDTGTTAALQAFLTVCDQNANRCTFAPGPGHTSAAKFATLMQQLRISAADSPSLGTVTYADAVGYVAHDLYKYSNWSYLADYLQDLNTAVHTEALATPNRMALAAVPAPAVAHRRATDTAADTAAYDNSLDIAEAVTCEDSNNPTRPDVWERDAQLRDHIAPYFGSYWTWLDEAFATWTVTAPARYTGPFDIKPAHPLLVIGVLRDPATRYADAVALADTSPGARLLTINGTGHTSRNTASTCAQTATAAYLGSGQLPHHGAVCGVQTRPFT